MLSPPDAVRQGPEYPRSHRSLLCHDFVLIDAGSLALVGWFNVGAQMKVLLNLGLLLKRFIVNLENPFIVAAQPRAS